MEDKKLADLKPGDKVTVKGMEMIFLEWIFDNSGNEVPVFYNEINGFQVNFSTTDFNRETLLKDIV